MTTLNIIGVPEHFNLPWRMGIRNGEFAASGIDLKWTDVPEGTGKMCQMLRDGKADIAVILTEGIVKDIIGGNQSKIIQKYVETPLIWGIHVAAGSDYRDVNDLQGTTVAISRPGSGSQLMACVNAGNLGWDPDKLNFETVHTIDGAVNALQQSQADYFMWEKFMTKPLVDSGVFRRIGECPTPWPCFVIVATDEALRLHDDAIHAMLKVINSITEEFRKIPGIDIELSQTFGQKLSDIQEWLSLTEWSQNNLDAQTLNKIQNQLAELRIIDKLGTFAEIVNS